MIKSPILKVLNMVSNYKQQMISPNIPYSTRFTLFQVVRFRRHFLHFGMCESTKMLEVLETFGTTRPQVV